MRVRILFLAFFLSIGLTRAEIINGKVLGTADCSSQEPYMLFVNTEDQPNIYLYQVAVPSGGSVDFNLKKGRYIVEGISKEGCIGKTKLNLETKNPSLTFTLKLEKSDD